MQIGVPKETVNGEHRVAMVPEVVTKLAREHELLVERGAGAGALIPDEAYAEAGARLVATGEPYAADIVVKVAPPAAAEIGLLRADGVLIGFLAPLTNAMGIAA